MMGSRRVVLLVAGAVVLVAMGVFAAARRTNLTASDDGVPVAPVKRGDLEVKIYTTGEVRASNTSTLAAPPIAGGSLRITHLLRVGAPVKKGDAIIEFDPSEQQYNLEQNRSELLQAEQEITKSKADAAVQAAQDKVALLRARFDVRRAELEVGKNELVSTIDAQKNQLALDQARRVLVQLEQDIKSHAASGQATIALAQEKRHKAQLAMTQAQQNIAKMRVTAPMDGVVAIEKNYESTGGFFFDGMSFPDYREGDQVQPGSIVARVVDTKEMEVGAKVNERDRGNLRVGQPVDVQLDALPGYTLHGTVKTIGGMATRNFWESDTGGKFDITVQIPGDEPRLRSGFTAQVVVQGDKRQNVLYVPRQSLFSKDGKRVVFVKSGNGFEPHDVKVQCETESRAAIEGLKAGVQVALADPTAPKKASNTAPAMPSLGGKGP